MILSDKYRLKEDRYNLHLEAFKAGGEPAPKGKLTADRWVLMGHYPKGSRGRKIVYNRLINLEISDLEKQTLEEILQVVETTSEQVIEWFEGQK
jgi:hypothetical protein